MPLRRLQGPSQQLYSENVGKTPRGQRAHGRDDHVTHKPQTPADTVGATVADPRAYSRPWLGATRQKPRSASVNDYQMPGMPAGIQPPRWSSYAGPPVRTSLLNTQLPPLACYASHGRSMTVVQDSMPQSDSLSRGAHHTPPVTEPKRTSNNSTRFTSAHLNIPKMVPHAAGAGGGGSALPAHSNNLSMQPLLSDGLGGYTIACAHNSIACSWLCSSY
jgi:hypothetical protein